jgi:predicted anti-sigma-YlaC factor YlaD
LTVWPPGHYKYHERWPNALNRTRLLIAAMAGLAALPGCRTVATHMLANAVAGGSSSYGTDDDPQLVEAASPFGLKTMESLLAEQPEHLGLLTSLARDFSQYTYAFVDLKADIADLEGRTAEARAGRLRAMRLYLRARDYGLRGLEVSHKGLAARLRSVRDLPAALRVVEKEDVPLLFWTAAAWGLAISVATDRMDLVAELPVPTAMIARALELDEAYDEGAIHEFYVTLDASRSEAEGGGSRRAKEHLDRALELSKGKKLGPLVSYAEGICVKNQDRAEFKRLLTQVLATDVESEPAYRMANVLAQRRARVLLGHIDDLFL